MPCLGHRPRIVVLFSVLTCEHLLVSPSSSWVSALPWDGSEDWNDAPEEEWTVFGARAGSVKAAGPLSFIRVAKAG